MSVAQLRCGREWPGAMLFAFAPVQVVWLRVCGGFSLLPSCAARCSIVVVAVQVDCHLRRLSIDGGIRGWWICVVCNIASC